MGVLKETSLLRTSITTSVFIPNNKRLSSFSISISTGNVVTFCSIIALGSIFETIPKNSLSLYAATLIETTWPIVTFPTSISSTNALTLTLDKSAIVISIVPPPTADVGEEITWPTSTGLEMIVP